MKRRLGVVVPWILFGLVLTSWVLALIFDQHSDEVTSTLDRLWGISFLAFPAVGVFLVSRVPTNPVGWLFLFGPLGVGAGVAMGEAGEALGLSGLTRWAVADTIGTGATVFLTVGIPVAIAVSITRYRLYEIDRIVSRTVSYGVLAMVVAGGVIGLQYLIPASGDLAVAASTLAAAALFNPMRRRVQGWMDRRFNRRRYDAGKVVDGFGVRLREAVGLATITGDLRTVITRTVEPVSAAVWVRGEGNR